jgi:protein-S-isoprenylcysteine O-methyltransferase Ste14
MGANVSSQPNEKPAAIGLSLKTLLSIVAGVLFMVAVLFIPAGRPDWVMGWAFIGLHLVYFAINMTVLVRKNPDLIAERLRYTTADTKGWDKVFTLVSAPFFIGSWIVAGLGMRFGWTPQLALATQFTALAFVALGYGLFGWAMVSNPFFSRVVRIQNDRGHTVATGGPYRYVRHPGYVGFTIASLGTPLALGSLWALIPAALAVIALVVRTALEDRTLHEELPGYAEYATRVRYRLLPGIW